MRFHAATVTFEEELSDQESECDAKHRFDGETIGSAVELEEQHAVNGFAESERRENDKDSHKCQFQLLGFREVQWRLPAEAELSE
jgi:hypothetical protein